MTKTFNEVYNFSKKNNISLRNSAYIISLKYLEKVYELRGYNLIQSFL